MGCPSRRRKGLTRNSALNDRSPSGWKTALTSYNIQQPHVLAFRQWDPEIVIDGGQRGALLDGRHAADQDAGDFFFPQRLKESAKRAV